MEKKKILVVDDEEDFLKITKLNLEKTGNYEVMVMNGPVDILSHVHDFKPDLIIMDVLMPVMDGLEACKILNKDPVGSKIPIITLSALDKDNDKLMMYKVGIVDYLTKPVERDDLIVKIERALRFR